ncbi:hypothetical protein C8R43DRAFT_1205290 [Mycena crocata]|nr:hypothetical protein C8R43DRAFT_1205290 [Mycena crocata]
MPELCSATINTTVCNARTVGGINWCYQHNEERIKLYLNYKHWHAALESGADTVVCDLADIAACSSMKTVREWNGILRSRYGLLNRCIKAREHFTERFFGNDMDFGHRTFWLSLMKQREQIEEILWHLEGRGYDLLLESQNAAWVREEQTEELSHPDCTEHGAIPEPTHARQRASDTRSAEHFASISDETKAELWEDIKWDISSYMLPATSRYYEERKNVVWAYMCRVIYTDPALLLLSLNYPDVLTFLSDPNHDISIVQRLKQRMRRALRPTQIRAAIDDVLRPKDGPGAAQYVTVLGIRLYKAPSGITLPFHAWGHVFAFRLCHGCNKALCSTVDELIESTRHALFTGSSPVYFTLPQTITVDTIPAARILAVCGVVFEIAVTGKRISIVKRKDDNNKTIWAEEKNPLALSGALSATDPRAHSVLNELFRRCLSSKSLAVMLRKGAGEPVIRSTTPISGTFQRTSESLACLRQQPWVTVASFRDSLLDELQPSVGCLASHTKCKFRANCMQFVVLDNGLVDSDERCLMNELLTVWRTVYRAGNFLDMCRMIALPYIQSGELELDAAQPRRPFLSNVADVLVVYQTIWGCTPDWADDYERFKDYPTVWPIAEQMSDLF